MSIKKEQKKEIIDDLSKVIKGSNSVVFVNFHNLSVADETVMRKALRASGVGYVVAKKTLAKIAMGSNSISGVLPELEKELALAYGEDLIAPAREVFNFQKKFKDSVTIMGGIFDGKYMTKEEMSSIALIPSKEGLYGMFVNIINSPIQRFVIALNEVAKTKTA